MEEKEKSPTKRHKKVATNDISNAAVIALFIVLIIITLAIVLLKISEYI